MPTDFSLRLVSPLTWCSPNPKPDFNSQFSSSIAQRFGTWHHLTRRQLGQIGHQDFGMLRAHAPLFAQHHSDVTDMT